MDLKNQFKAVIGIGIEDFIKIYKEGFIKLDCKDDIIRSIQVYGIDKVMEIWGNKYGKVL